MQESLPIADLPAQQGIPQQITIKTADDSDGPQYPGQVRIWIRICFLDAWKVLDQLYAETTRLRRVVDQLGERCRALEAALHGDMRGRLGRLEIHCGLTAADKGGSEDG